jgi:hypothetical protein
VGGALRRQPLVAAVRGGGACRGGERVSEHGRVQKSSCKGSRVCIYRARRGGGATTEVMAINGHGGTGGIDDF